MSVIVRVFRVQGKILSKIAVSDSVPLMSSYRISENYFFERYCVVFQSRNPRLFLSKESLWHFTLHQM